MSVRRVSEMSESDLYLDKFQRLFTKYERQFTAEIEASKRNGGGLYMAPCELAQFQTLRHMEKFGVGATRKKIADAKPDRAKED